MSAATPSTLYLDHESALVEVARLGPVVDLACGRGRHALAVARAGMPAVGLDRNPESLGRLRQAAQAEGLRVCLARVDLETGGPLPLAAGSCGALLIFRYLHRPIAAPLVQALAPGGLLIYETFTIYQRDLGYGPRSESFLLQPQELPSLFPTLSVVHHWEGRSDDPRPAQVAQLVARRPLG